jgi:hypothetical protein
VWKGPVVLADQAGWIAWEALTGVIMEVRFEICNR